MPTSDPIIVPAALGVVHAAERAGMPTAFSPILAIVAAVGLALLEQPALATWNTTVLSGIIAGLSAYGLYAGAGTVGQYLSRPAPPA